MRPEILIAISLINLGLVDAYLLWAVRRNEKEIRIVKRYLKEAEDLDL